MDTVHACNTQSIPPPTNPLIRPSDPFACVLRANPGAESLGLDFTVTLESFGVKEVAELLPGGKDMTVTDSNKEEYLRVRLAVVLVELVGGSIVT